MKENNRHGKDEAHTVTVASVFGGLKPGGGFSEEEIVEEKEQEWVAVEADAKVCGK
jgi:hypothetical protein